jgi:hypothetical protein
MELVKYISSDMLTFINNAKDSENKVYREILHQSPSARMQFMLIALAPNKLYSFIRDDQPGFMVFTCLYGTLTIRSFEASDIRPVDPSIHSLGVGDVLCLPRRYWRETKACAEGAVFTESIEGQYDPNKRQVYKDPDNLLLANS